MKRRVLHLFCSFLCALALLASPLPAIAEGQAEESEETASSSVIITEVQTGAATAGDEFIELYNHSDQTVDIAGWQIRYINSTTTTGTTTLLATITPTAGNSLLLESGKYFVLHTANISVPTTALGQTFTAALSKTDKTVALFARDETTCQMVVEDAVAWEATPGTTKGEGAGVVVEPTQANKEKLLQRYRDTDEHYVDTNHNSLDFVLSTTHAQASPGTDNTALLTEPAGETGDPSVLTPIDAPDCSLPEPEDPVPDPGGESPPSVEDPTNEEPAPIKRIPAGNLGLKSPQLSELLPNPASPKTDARDEFIELYNPNDKVFDLSGYALEVGTTSKRRYTFPAGTKLQPKTFVAFFSSDTRLSLSNTSSQVRLIDPLSRILVQSDPYVSAKDNQSWLLANGTWQWSTKPTPNAINIVSAPIAKKKSSAQDKSSAVKSASTEKAKAGNGKESQDDQQAVAATTTTGTPLHPGVLALVAASTLLYGAYEYRHDVANKIRKFRSDRATRRQDRPSA